VSNKPSFPMPGTAYHASHPFYARAMGILKGAGIDFCVGGAYAVAFHCGIERDTKDLDVMVRPEDCQRILDLFEREGYSTELTHAHWLGKIFSDDHFVDVIFGSGNGLCPVDDLWFRHAPKGHLLDNETLICPAEELIWSKSYIMERERFDGADVVHLIRARGGEMDWRRLLDRFGRHWTPLLMHLLAYRFVYPSEIDRVPAWVLRELLGRVERGQEAELARGEKVCCGTLISLSQYQIDIEQWGHRDGRLHPTGNLTQEEITRWVDSFR